MAAGPATESAERTASWWRVLSIAAWTLLAARTTYRKEPTPDAAAHRPKRVAPDTGPVVAI
jgi:hypothetical protein